MAETSSGLLSLFSPPSEKSGPKNPPRNRLRTEESVAENQLTSEDVVETTFGNLDRLRVAFHDDGTGTIGFDSSTIQFISSAMQQRRQPKRIQRVAASVANRVRTRMRTQLIPDVYVRAEDRVDGGLSETNRELVQTVKGLETTMVGMQRKLVGLEKRVLEEQSQVEQLRASQDGLRARRFTHAALPKTISALHTRPLKEYETAPKGSLEKLLKRMAKSTPT